MDNKRYKIEVFSVISRKEIIDKIMGNTTTHKKKWIEVVESKKPGVYVVVDDNITEEDIGNNWVTKSTELAFKRWDTEVENLDNDRSNASIFGMSAHLKWNEVDLNLFTEEFKAPCLKCLKEAFKHVVVGGWCPGDI